MRFCSISSVQRNIRRWPWEPSCWGLRNIQLFFLICVSMYRCFEANLEGLEISGCQDEQILRIFLVWKSWDCHSVIRSELTKLLRACEEVPVPQKWARDAQEFFFVGNCLEGWYNPWTFLVVKNPPFKGAIYTPWMEGEGGLQWPKSLGHLWIFGSPKFLWGAKLTGIARRGEGTATSWCFCFWSTIFFVENPGVYKSNVCMYVYNVHECIYIYTYLIHHLHLLAK